MPSPTDEELLSEIRRLGDELGYRPTTKEMDESGQYGVTTVQRRFGSWRAALERAGYDTSEWRNKGKPYQDEQVLRELYVNQGLSQAQIAERFNVGSSTISNWIRKHDIKKYAWRDEEMLRKLYHEEQLSMSEIAEELDTGVDVIHRWLHRLDIDTRSSKEGVQLANGVERAWFYTDPHGYERECSYYDGETDFVSLHRLLAVAEYGFEEVAGKVVHHRNEFPWDNRPSNIELLPDSEHKTHHAKNRGERPPEGF